MALHGPYGGYLQQVTKDYFSYDGLRGTHNSVLSDMSPELQEQAQPWLRDTVSWPPLLGELNRATLGAWGNYLGDMNRGQIADNDTRREVAVASTLTMGLLGAMDGTVRGTKDRTPSAASGFYENVFRSLAYNENLEPDDRLVPGNQLAAYGLARHMHDRLGFGRNPALGLAVAEDVGLIADATNRQLTLPSDSVGAFQQVAADLGEATASWALRYTELGDLDRPFANPEGRLAAEALGRLGGLLRHGTQLEAALRDHMPTYATATFVRKGIGTEALSEIDEMRADLASDAIKAGQDALRTGNRLQRGIFKMATRLLYIREMFMPSSVSQHHLEKVIKGDPYWQRAFGS